MQPPPTQPTPPRRGRPDYDQTLKRLLSRAHDGFLPLIAPVLHWREERSPELPAVARQADLVWEVEGPTGERGLLHIELQIQPDDDIGERVTEYKLRLRRRDQLPVHSVVVFLRPAQAVPQSPFVIPWIIPGVADSLWSRFDVIKLWEIPPERVLATPYYDLWPLACLMGHATIDSTVTLAERIAAAPLPAEERSELTALLVVLAEVRLRRRDVLQALRRNQMIDELVRNSGLAEEFRDEGKRDMVRVMLEGRFGPLGEDLLAALASADEATLEQIARHAGTDTTLADVRARLGLA